MSALDDPRAPGDRQLQVTVVLLNDGLSSTATLPVEIFHCAGALWNEMRGGRPEPRFRVKTVTLDGKPVRSATGFSVMPEGALADADAADLVVVPTSGLDVDGPMAENRALIPWLQGQYERGAYVAGVCMGAAYLAEAGLLDGRMATTHWAMADDFARRWPKVDWRPELFVTEDARVLCSGGVYAAIDLSLYMVEKLCGHEIALHTSKALLLPKPRLQQSGYALLPLATPHSDERMVRIEAFVHANFKDEIGTERLAEAAGLGVRTFVRHFKAATGRHPIAYIQAVRIEAAKAMLERDAGGIQAVSSAVGYEDVAFFRGLFKRATGMTPAEYRARFGPMAVAGRAELGS